VAGLATLKASRAKRANTSHDGAVFFCLLARTALRLCGVFVFRLTTPPGMPPDDRVRRQSRRRRSGNAEATTRFPWLSNELQKRRLDGYQQSVMRCGTPSRTTVSSPPGRKTKWDYIGAKKTMTKERFAQIDAEATTWRVGLTLPWWSGHCFRCSWRSSLHLVLSTEVPLLCLTSAVSHFKSPYLHRQNANRIRRHDFGKLFNKQYDKSAFLSTPHRIKVLQLDHYRDNFSVNIGSCLHLSRACLVNTVAQADAAKSGQPTT